MSHWEALEPLWEDKLIRFDVPHIRKYQRNGEMNILNLAHIEDTKGNVGYMGRLLTTNLRLVWHIASPRRANLSIGFARIENMKTKLRSTKLHGTRFALHIVAMGKKTRFEFLFTDMSKQMSIDAGSRFQSVFDVYRLYQRTYLYRDLKLHGAILRSGQLILLHQEQMVTQASGVWNLSSDQGNLGSFVVTNLRIVWYAEANETFNISIPYMQIAHVRLQELKFGLVLVIQAAETGGGYLLGFRMDPPKRLKELYKELMALYAVYRDNPNFGIIYDAKEAAAQRLERSKPKEMPSEIQEIDERQEREINSKLNTYLAQGSVMAGEERPAREPIYCKELGFAMERIRDGYKLKDLWDILPRQIMTAPEDEE